MIVFVCQGAGQFVRSICCTLTTLGHNPAACCTALNHSGWTLAAIDDAIARGKLNDWKELRDVAATHREIQERILRVCEPHLSDPYAQRYYFRNLYVRKQLAPVPEQ